MMGTAIPVAPVKTGLATSASYVPEGVIEAPKEEDIVAASRSHEESILAEEEASQNTRSLEEKLLAHVSRQTESERRAAARPRQIQAEDHGDNSVVETFQASQRRAMDNANLKAYEELVGAEEGSFEKAKPKDVLDKLLEKSTPEEKSFGTQATPQEQLYSGDIQELPYLQRIAEGVRRQGAGAIKEWLETSRQAIGGVADVVNSLFRLADNAVKKAEEAGLPNVYFSMVNEEGKFEPRMLTTEEFRAAQKEGRDDVLQIAAPERSGDWDKAIIRDLVQFMVGRGRVKAAVGGGFKGETLANFVSGALMGGNEKERLSNVIDKYAPNFITDFLAAKPEDEGNLISNLKGGLEMAGLGVAVDATFRSIIKTARMLKSLKEEGPLHVGDKLEPYIGVGEGAEEVKVPPQQYPEPSIEETHPLAPVTTEIAEGPKLSLEDVKLGEETEPTLKELPPVEDVTGVRSDGPEAIGDMLKAENGEIPETFAPKNQTILERDDGSITIWPKSLERTSGWRELTKYQRELESKLSFVDPADKTGAENVIFDYVKKTLDLADALRQKAYEQAASRFRPDLVRGPDWVLERLMRAKRAGELTPEQAEFGRWLLQQNPDVAQDLAVSIKKELHGGRQVSGTYTFGARLMELLAYDGSSPDVVVHEIMHHTERMLPQELQEPIRMMWAQHLSSEIAGEIQPWQGMSARGLLLESIPNAMNGDAAAIERLKLGFKNGVLKEADYQFVNPSEYWAMNSTRILENRYLAGSGWTARVKNWFNEFIEHVKGAFGMQSDAPVLAGIRKLMQTSGKFESPYPMGVGGNPYVSMIKRGAQEEGPTIGELPKGELGGPAEPTMGEPPAATAENRLEPKFQEYMEQETKGTAPLQPNEVPAAEQGARDFSATTGGPVKININMINGPDDLKDAIARVSSQVPKIDVRPNEEIIKTATTLSQTPDEFLSKAGKTLSDTEVVAVRLVVNNIAEQFLNAVRAAAKEKTPEMYGQALQMYTKFHDMMVHLQASKVASGRSVQAWGIPLGTTKMDYGTLAQKVGELAKDGGIQKFMERISQLETPEEMAKFMSQAARMSPKDKYMWVFYNTMLGLRTLFTQGVSDVFMASWNVATRGAAELGNKAGILSGGVQPGETGALVSAYITNFKDAVKLAGRSLLAGESQFLSQFRTMDAASDRLAALGEGSDMAIMAQSATRSWQSYLRAVFPTSWVSAMDDFSKFWHYRANLKALAIRDGTEKGLTEKGLDDYVRQVMDTAPEALHEQAIGDALKASFQEPLEGLARSIQQVADGVTIPIGNKGWEVPLGRTILPFVRTPVNIFRWPYRNTWLASIFPSTAAKAEMAAFGPQRDIAIASRTMGSIMSLSFVAGALNGNITGYGPRDPGLRAAWLRAGNKPYWINLTGDPKGGFGYNKLDPVATMIGVIADTVNIMKFSKEEDAQAMAESLIFGIGQAMLSKSYLSGFAKFIDTMDNPDVKSQMWFNNFVAGFVPADVRGAQRSLDQWKHEHYTMLTAVEANLPFVSEKLPLDRDLWGNPIPIDDGYLPFMTGTGAARWVSPVNAKSLKINIEPIDTWIWNNRSAFPHGDDQRLGLGSIKRVQSFPTGTDSSVDYELTPKQLDRLKFLAGNGLKDPDTGFGAKDFLNSLVQNKYPDQNMQNLWNENTPAGKAHIIQETVYKYRDAARKQLITEYPDIQNAIEAWQGQRVKALTPVPAQ